MERNWHNCSLNKCGRPVFCLTLCRGCYRGFRVKCNVVGCNRQSFCKQVCVYHYRNKVIPPQKRCTENDCNKVSYIEKCFACFTQTQCLQCDQKSFAKNLCQQHYMVRYRRSLLNDCTYSF